MNINITVNCKKRIEYIDLMKGFCIILIIMLHNNISFNNDIDDILKNMRIPLYFCLSGLFYKEYNGFFDFFVRKFNKLIIPFIFFSYIPFALCEINLDHECSFTTYILMVIEPSNYPLWFLRCLFITYLLYYAFRRMTKELPLSIQTFIVFSISLLFYILCQKIAYPSNIYIELLKNNVYNVTTAFIALPFFHLSFIIRKRGLLELNLYYKSVLILFCLFFCIWILTYQKKIDYMSINFGNNFIFLYLSAIGGIGCVWCLAYLLKKIFYISYIGRYSLIALGTHYPLILLFNMLGVHNKYIVFLCILMVMPGVIYIFKKHFPYMTAQKDLLIYKEGKLKLSIKK